MTTPSGQAVPWPGGISPTFGDVDLPYVLRAKAGDQTAFAPLWEKYWRNLYAYFARQISSREEAEDLASETLLDAFTQIPAFRGASTSGSDAPASALADIGDTYTFSPQATFRAYLRAIARYKLARWIRRRAHRPCGFVELESTAEGEKNGNSLDKRLGADVEADPLRALLRQENLDEVCYALADVGMRSSEQFKALLLHYLCGLPHKEIAELLETRRETVNTRLQEGRRTLLRHYQHTRTTR